MDNWHWLFVFVTFLYMFHVGYRTRERNEYAILFELSKIEGYVPGRIIVGLLRSQGIYLSYGTFYTICRRLVEKGYLEMEESEDEDGKIRSYKLKR